VDVEALRRSIEANTVLISIMHANNEIGTLQPIAEIAAIARERGILMHTDAAQSVGKVNVNVAELGVDLLSVAGHKMYAPQGVGALYVRSGVALEPFLHGAGHEQGRRAGTENVASIVGLGAACEIAPRYIESQAMVELRGYFWQQLQQQFGERVALNGHPTQRLPNTLNVSFLGHRGHDILARIPALAASTGSACHSGEAQPSPVLTAMGISAAQAMGAIRFSLGRETSRDQIDIAVAELSRVCN
jgi:cysteine desulfurase